VGIGACGLKQPRHFFGGFGVVVTQGIDVAVSDHSRKL
jgi:hypothetical protein